jgi:hypothetical protein
MIFLESPWPILTIGMVIEAILAIALWRTGRGRLLWVMFGVADVVFLGVVGERFVVTDREAIENSLDACVAAVKANRLGALLDYVAPDASHVRADARFVLERFVVERAKFTDLEITVNRATQPPTATAKFHALGTVRDRKGEVPYQAFSEWISVDFTLRDGRWLITGYQPENRELHR